MQWNTEQGLLVGSVILEQDFIRENARLKETDAAFIRGSWLEKLGHAESNIAVHAVCVRRLTVSEIDLDRYSLVIGDDGVVLAQDDPAEEVLRLHAIIPNTLAKIEIDYHTWDTMRRLALTVQSLYDAARDNVFMVPKSLSLRDKAIIHWVHCSYGICGVAYLRYLRQDIGRQCFLYLLYRYIAAADFSLVDLLAAWNQQAWSRSVVLARNYVMMQFQAYTHLLGNTHYHRQWVLPYAQRCGVKKCLMERFTQIALCQELPDTATKKAFVLSSLDFVDTLLAAGAAALRWLSGYPDREVAQHILGGQLKIYGSAHSEREVMYWLKAYGLDSQPLRKWFVTPARGAACRVAQERDQVA